MRTTSYQVFRFACIYMLSVPIAFLIAPLISSSGYQGWIAILAGGAFNMILIACTVHLGKMAPKQAWLEFGERIVGKWLHRCILIVIAFWCVYYIALDLEQFTLFYGSVYMRETPPWFLHVLVGLVIIITCHRGLSTVVYLADGFFIISILAIVFFLSVFSADADFHMFPALITHHKLGLALKDSFSTVSWIGEWFIFLFIVPELKFEKKILSNLLLGNLLVTVSILFTWLICLLNFGPHFGAQIKYPVLELIRGTSYTGLLGNSDPLLIGLWSTSMFIHDSFLLYVGTVCLAKVTRFSNQKVIITLLGSSAIVIAYQFARDVAQFQKDLNALSLGMFWVLVDSLPIYYVLIAWVRNHFGKKSIP
ncbi:Spore germination protein [compost metagenome]